MLNMRSEPWDWINSLKAIKKIYETPLPIDIMLKSRKNNHYKISQFYRRKYSVGLWLEVRRWFFYRRHHRRNTSTGFTFVGDSPFRRYFSRKNKKNIYRRFYRRNVRAKKKKIPAWNIPTDFHSVGEVTITDGK